jgi:pimeloyl-ACP methyl ester carboxylesterase
MGYSDVLGRHYRLILADARGHGASDKMSPQHTICHCAWLM